MTQTAVSPEGVSRFGVFELDARTGQLRRHGLRIRIHGQPIQILLMMLEHPGEVVTRQEMRRRLWPEDTFVDFEHSLNSAIKKLRQALGDSADDPHYVETLPRVGYRFIAPVEKNAAETLPGDGPAAAGPTGLADLIPLRRPWVLWRLVVFAAAAMMAIGILAYGFLSVTPVPRVVDFIANIPSDRAEPWGRLVTDGARVYFLERAGDHWNVVQTSTAGGEARAMAVPFLNTRIFDISRDRSAFLIASFEQINSSMPLWIWPVQGGSPVRLGNIEAKEAVWSPDGTHVVYTRGTEVRIVRRDGSDDRNLLLLAGTPSLLSWSPDGRKLSFSVSDVSTGALSLWEASADGSKAHRLFPALRGSSGECCGSWTPDGSYLLFTSFHGGTANLWAVRQRRSLWHWAQPQPTQLTSTTSSLWGSLPTGNGGRVFAFSDENETDAMNYSANSAQFRPFLANTHVLDLALSKDGKWIAEIMPDKTLWRSKVDGTERAQLVGGPLYSNHPSWSPDGKSIAFEGRTPGHAPRAYAIRFDGGTIEDVIPDHDDAEQSTPVWSADGASIAVALNVTAVPGSNVPRGIFIADWKSRRSRMLPGSEGFTTPVWSPDGKYLTAKTYDERGLMLYDANRQKWTELASGTALSGRPLWSKDSKYLYIQDLLEPGEPVYRLRAGDFSRERFIDFRKVLNSGIEQCALEDLASDGSPVILLTRRGVRVYVLDLDLP